MKDETRMELITAVVQKVTEKYYESASELISTVRKTESSLQKLRQRKEVSMCAVLCQRFLFLRMGEAKQCLLYYMYMLSMIDPNLEVQGHHGTCFH